jgi:hypothetical protein
MPLPALTLQMSVMDKINFELKIEDFSYDSPDLYGHETFSIIRMKKHRLGVFENEVLRCKLDLEDRK